MKKKKKIKSGWRGHCWIAPQPIFTADGAYFGQRAS